MATDMRRDAELVTAWVAGDQSAFAAVYDRYADALFAFALSRLRDRAAAADAVQDTFLRAARRVDQLRDRTRLRAWLYAIARNQVIDAIRQPALLATTELDDMTSDDRDPADVAAAHDAAALVRDAALGLNERDQELLDLYLHHGLDGADLADVAGLSRPQSYVAMNRVRARLGKAIGVVLIARHGSRDCASLSQLLSGWDGRFTLDVRSRVTRHVEGCPACSHRRTQLVGSVQLSAGALGIPLVVAPALLRGTTITRVAVARPPATFADGLTSTGGSGAGPSANSGGSTGTADSPPTSGGSGGPAAGGGDQAMVVPQAPRADAWRRDGFPVVADHGGRRRAVILIAAAAIIVVLLTGIALSRRGGGADADAVIPAPLPAPTVASTSTPSTPTPSMPPSSLGAATTIATTTPPTTVAPSTTPTTVVDATVSVAESLPAPPESPEPGIAAPGSTAPRHPDSADDASDEQPEQPAESTLTPEPPPAVDTTLVVPPPPPPPPPPDPGHITVLSGPITLGPSGSGGTVRIRNDGGQAAAWSASTGNGAFGVSPGGGSLEPGQEADIAVGVDRSALPEGAHTTPVTVGADDGGGSVNVSATVERSPVITAFGRTPPVVRTSGSCGPTLVSVSVTVTDESPISSVAVQWSSDGMFAQLTALSPNGGGAYTGQVGGFTSVGSHSLKAIVADARGNSTSQTTTVTVITC